MGSSSMSDDRRLKPPFHIAHLSGGSQIIFGSDEKAILTPVKNANRLAFFGHAKPSHVHEIAAGMGIKMLAADYGDHHTEIGGPRSVYFSVYPFGAPKNATIKRAVPYWSAVANAQTDRGLAAKAARIGHQITILNVRLANTIQAYHQCATAFVKGNDEFDIISSSGFTVQIAAEIQGLLNDLYSLRDFILAFYVALRFVDPLSLQQIRERLRAETQRNGLDNLILTELEEGGTIKALSRYRALVAHDLPLLSMKSSVHTVRKIEFRELSIPRLIFPIFEELLAVKDRGNRDLPDRKIDVEYLKALRGNPNPLDALDFCHSAFAKLLDIGQWLATQFKLKYEILTLTDKEIVSFSIRYD